MINFGLIPIRNFAVLDYERGIYRSAQPQHRYEYEWLKKELGIETIINLREESEHDMKIAPTLGIRVIDFKIKDHEPPSVEQAEEFMKIIQAENQFPIIFHCEHGHGRTSTFSVLAKIAMGWQLQDAIDHEASEFHYSFKHPAQAQFLIQNFG